MIELRDVSYSAGSFQLHHVSLAIAAGQYAVLMGQTGQGKTTILELLCGLRSVTSGELFIHGQEVTRLSPADRQLGYVPQDLALFPSMNVQEHLEFALRLRRTERHVMAQRTSELAELLGITHLLFRRTQDLSGGEAQRVALGRAISFRPQVLLLDEPLSALDSQTRLDMHQLLRTLKESTGMTVLHVTHNIEEAEALADRKLKLVGGQIVEMS